MVFDEITFDDSISPFINPSEFPNAIILSSYSKTYNIPGLKLGHMIANPEFIKNFYRYASTTYGSPPSFLYLTATAINMLERCRITGERYLPKEMAGKLPCDDIIFEEFELWERFYDLNKRFYYIILLDIENNFARDGWKKVLQTVYRQIWF